MKKVFFFSMLIFALSCTKSEKNEPQEKNEVQNVKEEATTSFIVPKKIILVWFENKGYSSIVGNANAPYINNLISKGTLFTNTYALTHPSYPNYVAFFSGDYNGVTNDNCIDVTDRTTPNLYTALKAAGKSFAWYSESMPSIGYTGCSYSYYREKHNPTTIFKNVPGTQNKRLSDLPTDYSKLEDVVCITPNMVNDMHDGTVLQGDTWLKNNLGGLVRWCRNNNSVFVVYFDEAESSNSSNRIPVVAVGQNVKANYKNSNKYDHYNFTKSICYWKGASSTWKTSLQNRSLITGLLK